MQTIVELPEYIKQSKTELSKEERDDIITHLAALPTSGVIMSGAGGVRKLRWSAKGKGKSGGVRIIYYYHNSSIPLFLLTVFGKSDKSNLTKAEQNELSKFVPLIVNNYGG